MRRLSVALLLVAALLAAACGSGEMAGPEGLTRVAGDPSPSTTTAPTGGDVAGPAPEDAAGGPGVTDGASGPDTTDGPGGVELAQPAAAGVPGPPADAAPSADPPAPAPAPPPPPPPPPPASAGGSAPG